MFTAKFSRYACTLDSIKSVVDGFDCRATIYRDDCSDHPDERDDGFWPSRDPESAGYVLPEKFDTEYAKASRVMEAWKNDEWFYCGIAVSVSKCGVTLVGKFDVALWGIECNYPDSNNEHLNDVANELLGEAISKAKEVLAMLCDCD